MRTHTWADVFADLYAEQRLEDQTHPEDFGALNTREVLEQTAAVIAAELESM